MKNRITRLLAIIAVTFGVALAGLTPAQASGSTVTYLTGAAYYGQGMSVDSYGVWYAFYPGQSRGAVTNMRVWSHSCVKWRYMSSSVLHTSCNKGTTNTYVTVMANTYVLDVVPWTY
jgi:hypothetical protein